MPIPSLASILSYGVADACVYRYNTKLQQAAVAKAHQLTFSGCPFEHDTCPQFCNLYADSLYGNSCEFGSRLPYYDPSLLNYGEVVGEGANPSQPVNFPLLRVGGVASFIDRSDRVLLLAIFNAIVV